MTTRRTFVSHLAVAGAFSSLVSSVSSADTNGANAQRGQQVQQTKIPQTDLKVSRIGYGCADLVPWDTSATSAADIDKAIRVVNTAYDNGINFFDHADLYAYGKSESVFGEVLKRTPGLRNKIVIQSKCGQHFIKGSSGGSIGVDLSYGHIVDSVETSLRRLMTDRLDILLLHAPDILMQPEEVAGAFDHLHRSGKVRYFGVSNHTVPRIELLRRFASQPIVANQIGIGLLNPGAIADGFAFTLGLVAGGAADESATPSFCYPGILDYCGSTGIQIQAWAPIRGVVSVAPDAKPGIRKAVQVLQEMAAEKETSAPSLALAWLMKHPAPIVPIIGAQKPEHIIDNCRATHITITRDEWYRLLSAVSAA